MKNVCTTHNNFLQDENHFECQLDTAPVGMKYDLYIFGAIGDTYMYINHIRTMLNANENDTIILHIDSCGGDLDTTIALINVMKECKAHIIAKVLARCCSAATSLFLSADQWIIPEDIEFMVHDYSSGNYGKSGELVSGTNFTHDRIHKFMDKIYEGFLSKDELEDVYKGVDLYFTDQTLGERIQKFIEFKNKVNKENEVSYISVQESFLKDVLDKSASREDVIPMIKARAQELKDLQKS